MVLAGALLGLVAAVALASRGHSPGGGSTHGVDSKLIWEFVLVGVLALFLLCLPIAAWVIFSTRLDAPPPLVRRKRAVRRIVIALALLLVAVVVSLVRYGGVHHLKPKPLPNPAALGGAGKNTRNDPGKKIPFDWLPAIVVLSVATAGAGVVGYVLFRKPPRQQRSPEQLAAELTTVLDESLDDLRSERDPRRAVIATYARMERTLAGAGLPRSVAEAPLEYLGRVLRELLHTSADAVSRLTALFERAKFSPHEIDAGMKNEAIDALVAVRDELRAEAV